VPSWRNDLSIAEDLIEELARIHGYDAIEPTLPRAALAPVSRPATLVLLDRARDLLKAAGLVEIVSSRGASRGARLAAPAAGPPLRRASLEIDAGMGLLCPSFFGLLRCAAQPLAAGRLSADLLVARVFLAAAATARRAASRGRAGDRGERASLGVGGSAPVFFGRRHRRPLAGSASA
jgi:phenylalanyl-tRNA synthetase beta chain